MLGQVSPLGATPETPIDPLQNPGCDRSKVCNKGYRYERRWHANSSRLSHASLLLLRPDEVSSRVTHAAILEVANNPLWGFVEHRHVLVGRLA
jgi:hypothetical protein